MDFTEVVNVEPVAVRLKTAAQMLDCSETTIWKMCNAGRLKVVKVGADKRVTVESIRGLADLKVAA